MTGLSFIISANQIRPFIGVKMEERDRQSVLERIEKLLALSRSSNPNEAAIALSRAQKLMREHNVSKGEIDLGAIGEITISTISGLRRAAFVLRLAGICAYCFGVHFFFTSDRSGVESVTFMGTKDRLEGAAYAHTFLQRQLKQVLTAYRGQRRGELRSALYSDKAYMAFLGQRFQMNLENSEFFFVSFKEYVEKYTAKAVESMLSNDCYSYVMGWLSSVRERVQEFTLDEREVQLILDYKAAKHPDLCKSTAGQRRLRVSSSEFSQGKDDGRDGFELLKGVSGVASKAIGFEE